MLGDVCQEVRARIESVVTAKMGESNERLSKLLTGCAKEASVREEADALKVPLAGFRDAVPGGARGAYRGNQRAPDRWAVETWGKPK